MIKKIIIILAIASFANFASVNAKHSDKEKSGSIYRGSIYLGLAAGCGYLTYKLIKSANSLNSGNEIVNKIVNTWHDLTTKPCNHPHCEKCLGVSKAISAMQLAMASGVSTIIFAGLGLRNLYYSAKK